MKMKNTNRNLIFIEIMLKGLGLMLIVLLQMDFESLTNLKNVRKARKNNLKRTLAIQENAKLLLAKISSGSLPVVTKFMNGRKEKLK